MKIIRFALLILLFLLSYWAGFYSYEKTLWLAWDQTLGGDKPATVYWSVLAYVVILVPLYLLICYTIELKVKRRLLRLICYPFFCALTFMVPTAFILMSFGGGSIFSAESLLFYSFFSSSGITFGIGFGLISSFFKKVSA
ncbi:magnesium-transporting ATPase (P-type) [Paenibacillus mucilaginosus]|uniref:hypothetical protein n=1 Tax=Paenibacillus mucilaginosus TaxID=61624 RepID=UPI003D192204